MSGYSSIILADAPLRYYRLGDVSGSTTVVDSSGNNATGTLSATGVTLGEPGQLAGDTNTAALFNGTSGLITVPTAGLPTGNAAWSLEAWINFSAFPANNPGLIVQFGAWGTTHAVAALGTRTNGAIDLSVFFQDVISPSAVALSTPHHVVGTYDGTTLRLYVDGALVTSAAASQALAITLNSATIGGLSTASNWYPGIADEVAIYGSALSATQVLAHYLAGVTAGILGAGAPTTSGAVFAASGAASGAGALALPVSGAPTFLASGALDGAATLTGIATPQVVKTGASDGMVLLPNAQLATERALYDAATDSTGGYTAYMAGVLTHIEVTRATAYTVLPDGALVGDYTATVASGTDIAVGDRISALTLLDGVTPWPGEWPTGSANEYFVVSLVRETMPFFLPEREVYLKRMTGGGPAHV